MDSPNKLYIMISKTDTGVGGIIRKVTGFPYNHVSMTLDPSFRRWVSFARFHCDTPLYGGFLAEPAERFLAKGQQIDVHIFALELTPRRFSELEALFSKAGTPDSGYIYNYVELLTLVFGIRFPVQNAYTCLGFANAVMGTEFRNIRELDEKLQPHLFYAGALNDLAPDTGDRSDIYFTRLGLVEGLARSAATMGAMLRRLFPKEKDPTPV